MLQQFKRSIVVSKKEPTFKNPIYKNVSSRYYGYEDDLV
jgi:hypothetical protein